MTWFKHTCECLGHTRGETDDAERETRCLLLINHGKVHVSVRWFVYFKLMSRIPATY